VVGGGEGGGGVERVKELKFSVEPNLHSESEVKLKSLHSSLPPVRFSAIH